VRGEGGREQEGEEEGGRNSRLPRCRQAATAWRTPEIWGGEKPMVARAERRRGRSVCSEGGGAEGSERRGYEAQWAACSAGGRKRDG
jgi:hypothetical protein